MRVLALDIGGTAIKSALLDEGGQVLQEGETPSEGRRGGKRLMERAKAVIDGYTGYDAIGVSTTGQVDAREGRIIFANENVPGYSGMQVARILRTHARVPVVVENDVNAAALGEAHFGAGVGERDFLCLTYGTGVGGAICDRWAHSTAARTACRRDGTHPDPSGGPALRLRAARLL